MGERHLDPGPLVLFREAPFEVYGMSVWLWTQASMQVVGWCCGLGPEHASAIARSKRDEFEILSSQQFGVFVAGVKEG